MSALFLLAAAVTCALGYGVARLSPDRGFTQIVTALTLVMAATQIIMALTIGAEQWP
jgi:hypothetical protein